MKNLIRKDLIEPKLCYEIVGALFEVSNELGPGHKEAVLQRAVAKALAYRKISFKEQVPIALTFLGGSVGRYFLDFLVEGKIILEIKSGSRFSPKNFKQVESYLTATRLPLAILAHFHQEGVTFKRIVNFHLLQPNS